MPRSYDKRRFPAGPYVEPDVKPKAYRGLKRTGAIGPIVPGDDIEVARWIAAHRDPRQRQVPAVHKVTFTPPDYYATADPTVGTPWVIHIEEDLAGWQLAAAELACEIVSSSGDTIVQLRKIHYDTTYADVDMLVEPLQVDEGEFHSDDSAAPYEIDLGEGEAGQINVVEWKDQIAIDLDQVGTSTRGLELTLFWVPS